MDENEILIKRYDNQSSLVEVGYYITKVTSLPASYPQTQVRIEERKSTF